MKVLIKVVSTTHRDSFIYGSDNHWDKLQNGGHTLTKQDYTSEFVLSLLSTSSFFLASPKNIHISNLVKMQAKKGINAELLTCLQDCQCEKCVLPNKEQLNSQYKKALLEDRFMRGNAFVAIDNSDIAEIKLYFLNKGYKFSDEVIFVEQMIYPITSYFERHDKELLNTMKRFIALTIIPSLFGTIAPLPFLKSMLFWIAFINLAHTMIEALISAYRYQMEPKIPKISNSPHIFIPNCNVLNLEKTSMSNYFSK
jgi:hypothetical protein